MNSCNNILRNLTVPQGSPVHLHDLSPHVTLESEPSLEAQEAWNKFMSLVKTSMGPFMFNLPWGFLFFYLCLSFTLNTFGSTKKYGEIAGPLPHVTIPKPLQVWSMALAWYTSFHCFPLASQVKDTSSEDMVFRTFADLVLSRQRVDRAV